MSNSIRQVVPKKSLLIEIRNLREALTRTGESARVANERLEEIEEAYIQYKREVKSITSKNLFKGLYAAFRLWKGERRFKWLIY